MSKQLVVALSKGRILKETLPLLADAGIEPLEDLDKSRKLLFDTNLPDVKLVIIRATDVPTYVQLGAADLGGGGIGAQLVGGRVLARPGAVATGRFRQHMDVGLINDGPVTLVVDSG